MKKWHGKMTALRVFACVCLLAGTAFSQVDKNRLAQEIARDAQANARQPLTMLMDIIGLSPGMSIAEIGAGRGRVVIHLADRVGPNGKVYAEDIDADRLRDLTERCRRIGFTNVEVILGGVTDPKLPPGALDLIVIVGSYQHFDDPVTLMRNARGALKANGRVAIVDRFAEKDTQYSVAEKTMLAQMDKVGFVFDRIDRSIEATGGGYVYLFRTPRDRRPRLFLALAGVALFFGSQRTAQEIFNPKGRLVTEGRIFAVASHDFDKDGRSDIVVSDYLNPARILYNDAGLEFKKAVPLTSTAETAKTGHGIERHSYEVRILIKGAMH